jgi:hypothetical protein
VARASWARTADGLIAGIGIQSHDVCRWKIPLVTYLVGGGTDRGVPAVAAAT